MAGLEVIIYDRFWVIAEGCSDSTVLRPLSMKDNTALVSCIKRSSPYMTYITEPKAELSDQSLFRQAGTGKIATRTTTKRLISPSSRTVEG
jgi:hypothetical protein